MGNFFKIIACFVLFIASNDVFSQSKNVCGKIVETPQTPQEKMYEVFNNSSLKVGDLSFSETADGRIKVRFESKTRTEKGIIKYLSSSKVVNSAKFSKEWEETLSLESRISLSDLIGCLVFTFDDPECGGFSFHFGCKHVLAYDAIAIEY